MFVCMCLFTCMCLFVCVHVCVCMCACVSHCMLMPHAHMYFFKRCVFIQLNDIHTQKKEIVTDFFVQTFLHYTRLN